jgi:hypothetical protein
MFFLQTDIQQEIIYHVKNNTLELVVTLQNEPKENCYNCPQHVF